MRTPPLDRFREPCGADDFDLEDYLERQADIGDYKQQRDMDERMSNCHDPEEYLKLHHQEEPATFADVSSENRELRILLAIAHAGPSLYTDDGELQDNRVQPFIDFKRDSVAEIERKLRERAFASVRAKHKNP